MIRVRLKECSNRFILMTGKLGHIRLNQWNSSLTVTKLIRLQVGFEWLIVSLSLIFTGASVFSVEDFCSPGCSSRLFYCYCRILELSKKCSNRSDGSVTSHIGNDDKPTDQPSNVMVHMEVTLPIIKYRTLSI